MIFSDDFNADLLRLMRMRRDVRHFRAEPLPPGVLRELLHAAALAPSVGLSQPWRFVSVNAPEMRQAIIDEFEGQNDTAAREMSDADQETYRTLKLAGLREAPEHLAVFVEQEPEQGRRLGRRTMSETVVYSVVAAIQNLWLLARARGIGVGWVSILRPDTIRELLRVPDTLQLVAYLCIGYPVVADNETPELERAGWETRVDLDQHWITR